MHKNQSGNFAVTKRQKREKRTRFSPKKANPGAFWVLEGMGTVANRCERIEKDRKARRKSWDGLGLGCRLGRLVACVPPARTRPTTRTAQGAAVPGCQDIPPTNEKWRGKHMLTSTFLAGAEGLEPSARGFGVDVETPQRERGRGGVGRFLSQVTKRPVLVWCCGKFRGTKRPKINQAQYDRNSAGVMIAGCVTPDSRKSLSPVRSTSALAWMAARRMGRSFTSRI